MSPSHLLLWIAAPLSASEQDALGRELLSESRALLGEPPSGGGGVSFTPLTEPGRAVLITLPLRIPEAPEKLDRRLIARLLERRSGVTGNALPCLAFSLQTLTIRNAGKRLVCFDMDSTLIDQEVIDEMARVFGFHEQVSEITDRAMRGELDFRAALRSRVALFRGLSRERAQGILPSLRVSPGGEELLSHLKSRGIRTVVVSGGFDFILEPFRVSLGLDHACGNSLPLDDQGAFLGTVAEPMVDAEEKRRLVADFKRQYGFQQVETVAVGDGANDRRMMEEAGISISFCGKPALAEACNTFVFDRNLLWIKPLL